jgi:hypothetical protein
VELKTAGSRCRALCYSMFTLQSGKFDFKPSAPLEEPVGLGGFFYVYGTIGPGLISFLRGFMLVCSHHKVGKFISDPGA